MTPPKQRQHKMAPSYENLPLEEDEFDESQIDFTDIEEQFQVRLDEGLDAFVVIDGLPVVPEDSKAKLVKFVLRKLNSVGRVKDDGVHMPVGEDGKTEGYVGVLKAPASQALFLRLRAARLQHNLVLTASQLCVR